MKKLFALLLALLMLLSLAACGEEEIDIEDPGVPVKEDVETEEPVEDGNVTLHENTYFSVIYDEAAGWSLAEDDYYIYETGGNAYLRILDEEGNTDIVVTINADEDDPEDFRKALYVNGFDQKAYVEGTLETVDVGGQKMLYVDQSNGDRFYFGRNEAAGVYYTIDASDWEDPRVQELVANITCTAAKLTVQGTYTGTVEIGYPEGTTVELGQKIAAAIADEAGRAADVFGAAISFRGVEKLTAAVKGDQLLVEGVDDFQGLREYQPGDSRKRLDWRAWSRGQGLHSKIFAEPQHECQWLTLAQAPGQSLEQQLSCLAGWVLQLQQRRQPYGLELPGTRIQPAAGEAHQEACLRALALYGAQE